MVHLSRFENDASVSLLCHSHVLLAGIHFEAGTQASAGKVELDSR